MWRAVLDEVLWNGAWHSLHFLFSFFTCRLQAVVQESTKQWVKRADIQEMPFWIAMLIRHCISWMKGCAKTKITRASSQSAVSNGREPGLCQAVEHCNLAEAPCNMISFLKLFSEQLQMGSRLIFARPGSRQCHCHPWKPVRLPCCVLWSWTWSSECTLNIQRWSRSLICCLYACPGWATALARQCCSVCPLLQ